MPLPKGRQRVRRPRDGECERLRGDDGSHGVRVNQRAGSVKEGSRCKGDGVCNCKVHFELVLWRGLGCSILHVEVNKLNKHRVQIA